MLLTYKKNGHYNICPSPIAYIVTLINIQKTVRNFKKNLRNDEFQLAL